MHLSDVSLTNWISIIAGVAAIIAVCIAYASYKLSKRTFALAARSSDLSKPNSTLYLIDSFRHRLKETQKTLYVFCVSVENKSTVQNTIVSIEMRLPLVRNGVERLAVFSHADSFGNSGALNIRNTIQLPAGLPPRGAVVANCCFEVPNEMLEGAEFDLHILRFKHTEGPDSELHRRIIMDVIDVQDLEKKRSTGVPV